MIDSLWYGKNPCAFLLWPFSQVFRGISALRRQLYRSGVLKQYQSSVPVIVVGNLSVGGNGKTPLVVYLVQEFLRRGFQPGVVSRGYGGHASHYPYLVQESSSSRDCGDEPHLIYLRTGCPVAVDPVRENAVKFLEKQGCNIIISDDGMQHYSMGRSAEIAVLDASRMLGNGYLLPMGPLREGAWRLKTVDAVVVNGSTAAQDDYFSMKIIFDNACLVKNRQEVPIPSQEIAAVSAIGNPQRFYRQLEQNGYRLVKTASFRDHAPLTKEMIISSLGDWQGPVVMTEKDAVKCREFALNTWYYLPISASLSGDLMEKLKKKFMK
ncbi:MAG: tetraacyldisaccharide 4'-kinase [Succinivibrionaceae bacterium]